MRIPSLKKEAKLLALKRCADPGGGPATRLDLTVDSVSSLPLPHASGSFGCVYATDVLEHVEHDDLLLAELGRIVGKGGQLYVTVPRCETYLGLNRLRRAIGMGSSVYGHRREGYSSRELSGKLQAAGFRVTHAVLFSGLVTEAIELFLNRVYLGISGESISPLDGGASPLKSAVLSLYAVARPLLRPIAALDRFTFPAQRYGIVVRAVRG